MNLVREYVEKAIKCAALLPPPGDDEVRKFAKDWLEMDTELTAWRDRAARIRHLTAASEGYGTGLTLQDVNEILAGREPK